MQENSDMNGILVVNKPKGLTSRDVVNRISKVLHTKKVGHTGTLDPLATGVLILTIGKCTKMSDFLTTKFKEYEATFVLGYETDTLDTTGKTTQKSDKSVTEEEIDSCIKSLEGKYLQEVPAYSAVKINGKKLYEYARSGQTIDLPKREVEVHLKKISYSGEKIHIRVRVSKGTYIRSLIRDIGRKLGTYATMTDLCRTEQGKISLKDAYTLDEIENGTFQIICPLEVLADIKSYKLDFDEYKKVQNGVKMKIDSNEEYIKFIYEENLIALYRKEDDIYRMYIKFV